VNLKDFFWKLGQDAESDDEDEKKTAYQISFNPNCRCWLTPWEGIEKTLKPILTDATIDGTEE